MLSSAHNFFLPHDPEIALASISELPAGRAEVLLRLYRQRFCRRQARFSNRDVSTATHFWLVPHRLCFVSTDRKRMIPKSEYRFSETRHQ